MNTDRVETLPCHFCLSPQAVCGQPPGFYAPPFWKCRLLQTSLQPSPFLPPLQWAGLRCVGRDPSLPPSWSRLQVGKSHSQFSKKDWEQTEQDRAGRSCCSWSHLHPEAWWWPGSAQCQGRHCQTNCSPSGTCRRWGGYAVHPEPRPWVGWPRPGDIWTWTCVQSCDSKKTADREWREGGWIGSSR